MPNYKGHLVGGATTYLIILQIIQSYEPSLSIVVPGFFFCMIGSLFPDVDIKSKGQKLFYTFVLCSLGYFLLYNRMDLFIAISLLSTVPLFVKHRGLFHQVWFLIFISITTGLIIGSYHAHYSAWALQNSLFFLAGALSHVLLDRVGSKVKVWLNR